MTTTADTITIGTKRCFHCGEFGTITLPVESGMTAIDRYEQGWLVQDAFPFLSIGLREQITSGTHPECWDKMFAFDEEDEEEE